MSTENMTASEAASALADKAEGVVTGLRLARDIVNTEWESDATVVSQQITTLKRVRDSINTLIEEATL